MYLSVYKCIHFSLFLISLTRTHSSRFRRDIIEYSLPTVCQKNQYFDTSLLSCVECDVTKNLESSPDRLRCVCNKFSKLVGFNDGYPLCTACAADSISTIDSNECIPCRDASCNCSRNEIRVERYLNGTLLNAAYCLPCSDNAYPSVDGSKCIPCQNVALNIEGNCSCPSETHIKIAKYCLKKGNLGNWQDIRSTYLIKFQSQSIDSYYLRRELQAALYLCNRKDSIACEHLSNICALTLYTHEVACMVFMQTHASPLWLFYDKDETLAMLNSKNVPGRYTLGQMDNSNILNFTILTLSLSGRFRSINKPMLYCQLLQNIRFGVNLNKECRLSIRELLKAEVEFFLPYLSFKNDEKDLLYALPVYLKKTESISMKDSRQQLVRKFIIVDNISGFKALPNFANGKFRKSTNLSVLRYMKSLSILINVEGKKEQGKISPPVIIIEYAELSEEDLLKDAEVILQYEVQFVLRDDNTNTSIQIAVGVLSGIALIYGGLKTSSYWKKHYNSIPNLSVLLWFFIYSVGIIGNVLILVCITVCLYFFIFYKGQTVPYILLPDHINEKIIEICTITAFSFKVIELIGFVYQQSCMDIFFIDWEQPRIVQNEFRYDSPRTSLRKSYSKRFLKENNRPLSSPSDIIAVKKKGNKRTKDNSSNPIVNSAKYGEDFSVVSSVTRSPLEVYNVHDHCHSIPVSTWRMYLVANEWLKLQQRRRISILIQAASTLCILKFVGVHPWTSAVPELTSNKMTDVQNSFTLQYAVCTLVYIFMYFIQWIASVTFYERYINNHLQKFIDLCSISNISVFILIFNYYGFYIHGRSVHGYADTDLATLTSNLKKEENDLCAHRGLVPGTTDQTFLLSVTESFKKTYDDIFNVKSSSKDNTRFLRSVADFSNWTEICDVHAKLKQFLSQFLDHSLKSEDYVIKEQHLLEKLCDIMFADTKQKSVFYTDNSHSFDRAMFYGNEWLLATFEIAVFTFTLTIHHDYILAAVATVLTSLSLTVLMQYNNKKNLCNKSLLDEKFLM